jgi:hypothetical protein
VTPSLFLQQQLVIEVEPEAQALTNSETPTRCSTLVRLLRVPRLHSTFGSPPRPLRGMLRRQGSARYPAVPVSGQNTPHAGNGDIVWVIRIGTIIFTFTGFGREEGLQYVKGKCQKYLYNRIHSSFLSFLCYEIFLYFAMIALITRLYL